MTDVIYDVNGIMNLSSPHRAQPPSTLDTVVLYSLATKRKNAKTAFSKGRATQEKKAKQCTVEHDGGSP